MCHDAFTNHTSLEIIHNISLGILSHLEIEKQLTEHRLYGEYMSADDTQRNDDDSYLRDFIWALVIDRAFSFI